MKFYSSLSQSHQPLRVLQRWAFIFALTSQGSLYIYIYGEAHSISTQSSFHHWHEANPDAARMPWYPGSSPNLGQSVIWPESWQMAQGMTLVKAFHGNWMEFDLSAPSHVIIDVCFAANSIFQRKGAAKVWTCGLQSLLIIHPVSSHVPPLHADLESPLHWNPSCI